MYQNRIMLMRFSIFVKPDKLNVNFKYSKKDKLKSKKLIEQLFTNGKAVTAYPLRLVYLKTEHDDGSLLKTGVSVSKRLHKTAVSRNQIKRLLREAYRLNKPLYFNNSSESYAFMILYLSKDGTTFDKLNDGMKLLFRKFTDKTATHEKTAS
nr:ribonuclease P protein component [Winogradskyella helgolandensis]